MLETLRLEDPSECIAAEHAFASRAEVSAMFDRQSAFWNPLNRIAGYPTAYRDLFARLRGAALLPQGLHGVLDAGCGTGALGAAFASAVQAQAEMTALDLSPRMLTVARRHWNPAWGALRTVTGDVEQMEFPEAHFDVVLSAHCLEHTSDARKTIAQFARVLRPGGLLILAIGRPGPLDAITRIIWRSHQIEACDVFGWMWEFGISPLGRTTLGSRAHLAHWLSHALIGSRTKRA